MDIKTIKDTDAFSDIENFRDAADLATFELAGEISNYLQQVVHKVLVLTSAMDTGMFVLMVELGMYTPENEGEQSYYERAKEQIKSDVEAGAVAATIERVKAHIFLNSFVEKIKNGTLSSEEQEIHEEMQKKMTVGGAARGKELYDKEVEEMTNRFEEMTRRFGEVSDPIIVPGTDIPQ